MYECKYFKYEGMYVSINVCMNTRKYIHMNVCTYVCINDECIDVCVNACAYMYV